MEDSTVHLELSMKPDLLAKDGTNQVSVGVMFLVVCRQVLHQDDRYVVWIIGLVIAVIWELNEDNQLQGLTAQ